jgi:hypothetical protein
LYGCAGKAKEKKKEYTEWHKKYFIKCSKPGPFCLYREEGIIRPLRSPLSASQKKGLATKGHEKARKKNTSHG